MSCNITDRQRAAGKANSNNSVIGKHDSNVSGGDLHYRRDGKKEGTGGKEKDKRLKERNESGNPTSMAKTYFWSFSWRKTKTSDSSRAWTSGEEPGGKWLDKYNV